MKKLGALILSMTLALSIISSAKVSTAHAAESTTTILPINLAVGGTVTASGENGFDQGKTKAFDQFIFSKWLTFNSPAWLQYEFPIAKVVNSYSISSAEDAPERDPRSWVLKGSNDGINWTNLDTRENQSFSARNQTLTYSFTNSTAYKYVKFDQFTNQNNDGYLLQLSEIKLFNDSDVEVYKMIKPTVTVSGSNTPTDHANLVDGSSLTKWITYNNTAWLHFDFGEAVTIDGYSLTSAKSYQNNTDADPKGWVLQGSNDNTNWTNLDTKTDEYFKFKHQRKHFLLSNNTTPYRYYKLNNIKNRAGYAIQLSEVEFSRTNDHWRSENPIIIIDNMAGNHLFDQALPNAEKEIAEIIRKVNDYLYASPTDMPLKVKKFEIQIMHTDMYPGAAAWIYGDSEKKVLVFRSQHITNMASHPDISLTDEIIGMLYHEIAHAYQYSNFDTEAIADSLRFAAGYHNRYPAPASGSWYNTHTPNFIRWIDDVKHRGFLRKLNATSHIPYGLDDNQIIAWKESQIQTITGINVNTLWTQYQQSLTN
ncbi:discoidin domain-containing protein [Paenibacillus sp. L3-i20]|uniref:discoidin domain-containing protein n=1 Tax=Paenibacillus sp. L3-i20 TaxID=2905833 RepID=UPI001EE09A89|nr:discoidin domain-containing protein [Paenibacillus sp. L3-i20]GKU78880.1 hypothetical protein L3i20_v232770 [Paenibacillus sp. L3-i20]